MRCSSQLVVAVAAVAPLIACSSVAAAPAQPSAPHSVLTGSTVGDTTIPDLHSLQPAGDLQGNGKLDVLDIRTTREEGQSRTVGVTARHGATGTPIWAHRFNVAPIESVTFVAERLGAHALPGVLVVESTEDLSGGGTGSTETLTLTALAGATGKTIWSTTMSGVSDSNLSSSVPLFIGSISNGASAAASALITLDSSTATQFTVVPELVSGVDGRSSPFSGSETTSVDDGEPSYQVIGDLNGDGVSDVILRVPGSSGFVRVFSGKTGGSVVTVSGLPQQAFNAVQTVGKITGGSRRDLAVDLFDPVTSRDIAYLVSGTTGDVVWSRPASAFYVIGRAGPHRVPALGLYREQSTGNSTTTVGVRASYQAVSGANQVVYSKHVSFSTAIPHGSTGSAVASLFQVGDVQPDGATEIGIDLDVATFDGTTSHDKHRTGVVDGSTGAFHPVAAQVGSDGSLHKGAGADLLAVGFAGHRPVLIARDGTTRRRLYRRTLAVGAWLNAAVGGLRVSGHSCSDVGVVTETMSRGGLAVISGSGHPLWLVTFHRSQVTGGTVRHYSKPRHPCA